MRCESCRVGPGDSGGKFVLGVRGAVFFGSLLGLFELFHHEFFLESCVGHHVEMLVQVGESALVDRLHSLDAFVLPFVRVHAVVYFFA